MPFNLAGTLAALQALVRPRVIIPNLIVQDIRELNFAEFRKAGFERVVLDKDNCLTLPHDDALIPELEIAWEELKHEFGSRNLLVVSNSAGTRYDPGGLAAETVSHKLGVSVLRHSSLKPSRQTISAIQRYFTSLPPPIPPHSKWIVIGDRVLTDVVLGNRLGSYSVLVTRDWTHAFQLSLVGKIERTAIRMSQRRTGSSPCKADISRFTRRIQERKDEVKLSYSGSTWTWVGRAFGWGPNSGTKS